MPIVFGNNIPPDPVCENMLGTQIPVIAEPGFDKSKSKKILEKLMLVWIHEVLAQMGHNFTAYNLLGPQVIWQMLWMALK